jgi:flagellar assembly protein FliH
MKWSESIVMNPLLRDVRLLVQAPAQEWEAHVREREQAAYERGRRDGERRLGEQLFQQRSEFARLQQGVLNALNQAVPQVIQESEQTLIALALEAAQKIVAGLPIDAAMVEAVVREALGQIEDSAEVTVQLHPEDLALLRKQEGSVINNPPDGRALKFIGSSEVTRGGALVQTRFGLVDARRETKIEQLQESLRA